MKAEVMLPLMAMILQAGILSRQNAMLQRQNDLISEVHTRLNEHDEKLSAPDATLATVHTEIKQTSRIPPSEPHNTLPRTPAGIEIDPATMLAAIAIMVCYTRHSQPDGNTTRKKKKKKRKTQKIIESEETEKIGSKEAIEKTHGPTSTTKSLEVHKWPKPLVESLAQRGLTPNEWLTNRKAIRTTKCRVTEKLRDPIPTDC